MFCVSQETSVLKGSKSNAETCVHCEYYLTLLVIYERLNILKNDLALRAMYSYNLHPAQPEEPGSSLGLGLEFFLATVLLQLHCLLFGVLGWVSV